MGQFEWDRSKAKTNSRKHDVSFDEAIPVFKDAMADTIDDPLHSNSEARKVTVGRSTRGRVLSVIHTSRGRSVRIISAQCATRQERERYEEA